MSRTTATCPKSMVFGPCGGVCGSGSCEVDDRPCPFVADPAPRWTESNHRPRPIALPDIIVDIRPAPSDRDFDASMEMLTGSGVAGLVGDHVDEPEEHDVVDAIRRITRIGLPVIASVACRGRSVEMCARAIDDRMDAGAATILCVTGDHPAARFGPTATASFHLDGPRLAELARSRGAGVAVAWSPAALPHDVRPRRLIDKERAGADIAILNHAGDVHDLVGFADEAERVGTTVPLVAPVPVITDRRSLAALRQFPGVRLPSTVIDALASADDAATAGIDAAVEMGRDLLASGRFTHLDLSGRATGHGQLARNRIMSEIATRIRSQLTNESRPHIVP